ncbi:MAG: right-handed parallel beta-helix repeat-containing protein, partial [Alphaproteobacteria bacterium]|nr:right-handed parallel beta-helix repeat-containing protein [Alphaproteobacteria bacterium]
LKVVDTSVYVEEVTLSNSSSYGFQLGGSAVFAEGSHSLTLDSNYEDGELPAGRVHSLPEDLRFLGQTDGAGRTRGFHALFVNGTSDPEGVLSWRALDYVDTNSDGVDDENAAYWVLGSFYVTGTAEAPSILTLEPGTRMWMGDNTAIYVSTNGGAGGFIADASGGDPIEFTAAEAQVVGRWQGIKVWDHCLDDQVIFSNVSISYAGGTGDTLPDANLVLNGCDALLEDVTVDHSDTNGVLISGDPIIIDSQFDDNDVCGIQVSSGDPSITGSTFTGNGGGEICY